ncbi:ATP-dependent RNA helicase DbpA [Bdellovibrio sp. ZAP7]|uniref:ATP-dependent RNA helicase DbpA n=1 Tax=Bdellovibrio sp. ZAP7 TaxID=2231053 RepID=UPI0011592645|nr:ATP-dependent RNA helicase DbpA [Bdellovibrio sp. ZAP7]QDK45020.1 ATP-dependent RNA helicase DbpA [Bdellovibrio sp. ZAP7]
MNTTNSFSALNLKPELLTVVEELGFSSMTPIQEKSIPVLLAGKDVIGQSKTGSGKTAAFLLPILQQLEINQKTLQALIICPTRELAIQVLTEVRKLGRGLPGLQTIALTGGGQTGREQQLELEKGVQIAVGTPGRILDLASKERLFLDDVKTVVLDEADKMFDMGFIVEIKNLMRELPVNRQTVLFSATFTDAVLDLSKRYQKNPQKVSIEEGAEALQIEEVTYDSEEKDKAGNLMRVLQQHQAESCIVFCNTKNTVNDLMAKFSELKASATCLHGDLEQKDRERVMALFKNGSAKILVATDVAARGLDIENLELVVNYDFPLQPETYVHRVGRTGRAGKSGVAVTLLSARDTLKLIEIENITGRKFQKPNLGFKNQFGLNWEWKQAPMQTLMISGGRKNKIRPGDILGALTGAAGGLKAGDIGKIEMHDTYTYVAIRTDQANHALNSLRNGKIKAQKFQVKIVK